MLSAHVSELLQREESLQIDNLTEEVDSAPQMNPNQYENSSNVNVKVSMSSWMQALMSAEKGSVMYSDDYCTFSHTISGQAVKTHMI